jgi:hypothetical protein
MKVINSICPDNHRAVVEDKVSVFLKGTEKVDAKHVGAKYGQTECPI